MKINVMELPSFSTPIVGNVYSVSGGYGRKAGHAMVLLAITERQTCLMLVIDKGGLPVGVTAYGLHAIEERTPIAFVRGISEMTFEMEPIS